MPFSSRYREICHPIVDLDRKAVAEVVKTFGFMWFAESPDDFRYAFYLRFYEVPNLGCVRQRAGRNRTACDAWSRLVPQTKFEAVAEVVNGLLIYSLWGAFLLVSPLPPPATRAQR